MWVNFLGHPVYAQKNRCFRMQEHSLYKGVELRAVMYADSF